MHAKCAGPVLIAVAIGWLFAVPARGQETSDASQGHQHEAMNMAPSGWQFMHDGVVYGMFNHQGGPRGGDEFVAPNWWMGMLSRRAGRQQVTFDAMVSLDPATVGAEGYRELFQVGEVYRGAPLVDRQHPHDLFMQLAGIWRVAVTDTTGFTVAGGPAAEPALGPVAFMHRPSAAGVPIVPLSHHTFDSTHISYGAVTVAVDHGPWVAEASVFNGREPDEHRWDLDFGRLDSVSARVWWRPGTEWEFQASTGHLRDPEALEPGDIQRTTASASWFRQKGTDFMAVTAGYGVNVGPEWHRHAAFGEFTRESGANSISGRAEVVQLETALLLGRGPGSASARLETSTLGAFTVGAARTLRAWRGFQGALGAQATLYAVPDALKATHGDHPASVQVFVRLRLPAGTMGRMWNMRMSQPMSGHSMSTMDGMEMGKDQ